MTDKNNDLLKRLLATFRSEADEHVKAISNALLALEKLTAGAPEQQTIIETVFRQAHSLKGAARAVKFTQIEAICQPFESVFAALRDQKMSLTTTLIDLLHQAIRFVAILADSDPDGVRERQPEVAALVRQLDRTLRRRVNNRVPAPGAQPAPAPSGLTTNAPTRQPAISAATTVRISTKKLDAVMRLSEEMLVSRLSLAQRAADIEGIVRELAAWRKRSAKMQALLRPLERRFSSAQIEISGDLRTLLDHVAEEQVRVSALQDQLANIHRSTNSDRRNLALMTEDLQQKVREMQLLSCATLLDMFALQARDLAREQGKSVNLDIHGSDIELDRRLLDEIKDPLLHLVRNCVDHGIESPAQRQKARKPVQGNISIAIAQKDSGKITITVTDDGKGIEISRLKSAAVTQGMLGQEEAEGLSETAALDLIFKSGLSTSSLITDVSGRGLGMAIVRDKIEQLGGSIEVTSEPSAGTRFQIVLPVHLSTFRGTLIGVGDQIFIVASANVDRVVRIQASDVHHVNNSDTVGVEGQALALVWLNDVLGISRLPLAHDDNILAILLGRGAGRIAFRIDTLIGEQEVLVKSLGPQLRRVRNVTGASVLGNGQVVPVLNVSDLLEAATHQPTAIPVNADTPAIPPLQYSILVAEDSITSRSLMKNILEAAGYRVVTAVDGIDAYTTLKTQAFDLVVSDVDMPRMNGFDLTARLRADKQLAEIPVVLVTTLDSREDRERGIDAGANAYILKSSFDQNNLLDVIQRLI